MKLIAWILMILFLDDINLLAQSPIITQSEIPKISTGYVAYSGIKYTTSNEFTKKGANQVWDFSTLSDTSVSYALHYMNPANTNYASLFPNSTLAVRSIVNYGSSIDSNVIEYFIASSSEYSSLGAIAEGSIQDTQRYSPSLKYLSLPASYNDSFQMPFDFRENSYSTLHNIEYLKVDGYGELKLPNYTFNNVLRVTTKTKNQTTNNSYWYMYEVEFYDMSELGKVFMFSSLTDSTFTETNSFATAIYLKKIGSGIETTTQVAPTIFPNPSSNGKFKFYVNNEFIGSNYTIIDFLGKVLLNSKIESSLQNIDLSSFPKGIYLLELVGKENVLSQKIISE